MNKGTHNTALKRILLFKTWNCSVNLTKIRLKSFFYRFSWLTVIPKVILCNFPRLKKWLCYSKQCKVGHGSDVFLCYLFDSDPQITAIKMVSVVTHGRCSLAISSKPLRLYLSHTSRHVMQNIDMRIYVKSKTVPFKRQLCVGGFSALRIIRKIGAA